MNVAEGARRIKTAGRWIVLFSLCTFVFALFVLAVLAYLPIGRLVHSIGMLDLVLLLLMIATPGAGLWLAGWITEGFAKDGR
jgi:quinol-cytochrome oxidoreductase complex cytochrome b subunit